MPMTPGDLQIFRSRWLEKVVNLPDPMGYADAIGTLFGVATDLAESHAALREEVEALNRQKATGGEVTKLLEMIGDLGKEVETLRGDHETLKCNYETLRIAHNSLQEKYRETVAEVLRLGGAEGSMKGVS